MSELELRPLMPQDAGAARALVSARLTRTRYEARVLEQLDVALSFEDPEYMALLAVEPESARVVGLVMFGTVAGAHRVTRLHVLLGDAEVCTALARAVRMVASDSGERMVVAEVADDAPFRDAAASLLDSGFVEEGRADDFVSDGVGMRFLAWRS